MSSKKVLLFVASFAMATAMATARPGLVNFPALLASTRNDSTVKEACDKLLSHKAVKRCYRGYSDGRSNFCPPRCGTLLSHLPWPCEKAVLDLWSDNVISAVNEICNLTLTRSSPAPRKGQALQLALFAPAPAPEDTQTLAAEAPTSDDVPGLGGPAPDDAPPAGRSPVDSYWVPTPYPSETVSNAAASPSAAPAPGAAPSAARAAAALPAAALLAAAAALAAVLP